jgi:peptidoglycan hydrolase-like protein with peptidoglycan-binding domain
VPGADPPVSEKEIFVSYSKDDAVRVQVLVAAIEREGWKVFWDQEILPGEDWESSIGVHLDAAPVVIAVWSKHSVKSRYVRSETNRANKRNVVVPVLIDAVEPPFGLEHIQAADLVGWLANGGGTLPARLKSSVSRRMPSQPGTPKAEAIVAVSQPATPPPAAVAAVAPAASKKRQVALWIGVGAVAAMLLGGSGYYALQESSPVSLQATTDKAGQDAKFDAQEELAKLRGQKAEEEANQLRREAAARQKAEELAKLRDEAAARQKAAAEMAASRKAEEDARKAAEAAESDLHLTPLDRQHVQVALAALGFDTGRTDDVFVARTREQIAAWQKSRSYPDTGFLTGVQDQELLRDAAPAVSRFDKQNDEVQQQAEAQARQRAQLDLKELALQLQVELARVGCDPGTPDGVWGSASRQAMQRYNQSTKAQIEATAPTAAALADVRTHTGRVCPLTCGIGYKVDGDKCVAIAPVASPADKRDAPQSLDSPPQGPPADPPAAPNKTTALRPDAGVGGRWVDNYGAVYSISQAGDRYHFTASGQACRGPYTSQGTGVVTGQRVEVSYRSTYSVGSCIGTISADGNRITSDCRDSVCGPFRTTIERR